MKKYLYLWLWLVLIAIVVAGCSTGLYLRPTAVSGSYSAVNPSCPGALEVIEFFTENQPLVKFRVYATPPGRYESMGTELRVHFELRYMERGWSAIWPTATQKKLIEERKSKDYIVTASKPTVMVLMPNGSKREIPISIFEQPYDLKHDRIDVWGNGVQISPGSLDSFTVYFPDIYVNGKKIKVPPIHFQKDEDHYAPVLNC
jgi:hypothetical protein